MGGPGSGGANRKPTALKVLHGDDKKNPQRINRNEPIPGDQPILPPVTLTADGLEVWQRLAQDRIDKGVLTIWDVDAFALFCEAIAQAHEAARHAGEEPERLIQSPMSRFKDAVAICASLGGRFGWTPSDRAKLVVGGRQRDPKEDLLTG